MHRMINSPNKGFSQTRDTTGEEMGGERYLFLGSRSDAVAGTTASEWLGCG